METNESILSKGVVALKDRKLMGTVKDVIINCDTCSISHYIVSGSGSGSGSGVGSVLPFAKTLSTGDTFITIQSSSDFLGATDLTARGALEDNFDLIGLSVYSRAGSLLSTIKSFEIDTTYGKIAKINLDDGNSFDHASLVFFSPDFAFVDDGTEIDADIRAAKEAAAQ